MERSIAPDILRGAASLAVAAAHAWQIILLPYTGVSTGMKVMGGVATWSVGVFFILSGMMIGGSISAQVSRGSFSLLTFAKARFYRIYPPLFFAVVLTVACVWVIQSFDLYGAESYKMAGDLGNARPRALYSWPTVIDTLTLVYKLVPGRYHLNFNGALWSLSFEVWFYVLAGLLTAVAINRSAVALFLAAALCYQMFCVSDTDTPPFWVLALVWFGGFAYSFSSPGTKVWLADRWLYFVGLALLACLSLAGENFMIWIRAPYYGVWQHLLYISFSVCVGFSMIKFMQQKKLENYWVARFFANSAAYSYTLYLIHFPLFLFLVSLCRPSLHQFGLAGAGCFAVVSFIAVIWFSKASASVVENRVLFSAFADRLVSFIRSRASSSGSA